MIDPKHPDPAGQAQIPGTAPAEPAQVASASTTPAADQVAGNGPSKRSQRKGGHQGRKGTKRPGRAVSAAQDGAPANLAEYLASFAPDAPKLNVVDNMAKHLIAKAEEYEGAGKLLRAQATKLLNVKTALAQLATPAK